MIAITQHSAAGLSYLACDGGAGMPIVLLHGIGSNALSFTPLMQASGDRCAMLAWDAPGYGESEPLAQAWPDASDYAAALKRLLAHLDVSRCVLVGHSLGALIAARFAAQSPAQVAALALISPALGYGAQPRAPLPPTVADRLDDLDRLGPEKFAAARAPGLLANPAARPDVLAAVARNMAAIRRPGYDQAARMLATGNLQNDAAKIDVPTVVIVGVQDRITPPANARRVFGALRGPSGRHVYREISDAGHAVCQEHPAEVAQALVEIVQKETNAHA